MESSRDIGIDWKVYGNNLEKWADKWEGKLQERNRKISKLTSKKKVILCFEAYSYLCLFLLNIFCFHGKHSVFVPNCSKK
jgi:hypothetical protein